ncbi:MAG: hypothetical protein ACHQK9_06510 [Reyranellales bacterium]
MARLSTMAVYRGTAALIWGLAIWHCWVARGLFIDGSAILVTMIKNGGFALFFDSRRYVMALTQMPVASAIEVGVTDTQTLSRLLSVGLFFAPTAFYHACLFRARRDPALLAAVVCAIAVVFLPTSFFVVGEYNSVGAAVLFAGLVLVTGTRSSVGDGVLLGATAALLMRSYETMVCYGPLLAMLTVWRMAITGRRGIASVFYLLAVMLFLASVAVSVQSLLNPMNPLHFANESSQVLQFWRNLQFTLPLSALVVVVVAGLAAPALLESRRLYLGAGVLLLLLAACPLLWLTDGTVRPFARTHYHARTMGGVVIAAIVVAIWLYGLRPSWAPRALSALAQPPIARRFLAFQVVALLAALPADILLTNLWWRSLAEFQSTISQRSGFIPLEETSLGRLPYSDMTEQWTLPSESLVIRRKSSDGIVLPPRGYADFQPFDATRQLPYDADKYLWGGQGRIQ